MALLRAVDLIHDKRAGARQARALSAGGISDCSDGARQMRGRCVHVPGVIMYSQISYRLSQQEARDGSEACEGAVEALNDIDDVIRSHQLLADMEAVKAWNCRLYIARGCEAVLRYVRGRNSQESVLRDCVLVPVDSLHDGVCHIAWAFRSLSIAG
jgi:hypothetical protein